MNFSQHTANFLLICLVYRQTLQHFARVSECFLCLGPGTISKVFIVMLQFSAEDSRTCLRQSKLFLEQLANPSFLEPLANPSF